MFFDLSKFLWMLIDPINLILPPLVIGVFLLWTRWKRTALGILTGLTVFLVLISILPIGNWMIWYLEDRFSVVRELPEHVDGIIVLGGSFHQSQTRQRDQISLTGNAERLTEFVRLARHYPDAKLVFTGGSSIPGRLPLEADIAKRFFHEIGLDVGRIVFERRSRNTAENAELTKELVTPGPDTTWLLVTSAFHMPRAVGSFRKAGWRITPYPVDFKTALRPQRIGGINVVGTLRQLSLGLHEWVGLVAYRLTDRTDAWLPSSNDFDVPKKLRK